MDREALDISFEGNWIVKNQSYNKETESLIETLLAQGNGYFVSRAHIEECETTKVNYPGNYIVGLYNKALHIVGDKKIERDEIVNLPNFWQFNFKIENNSWFDINHTEINEFERKLDIKTGLLSKIMLVKDKVGHLTKIETERIINYKNHNIVGQSYTLTPVNYSGKIKILSRIDGNIYNERDLKIKHLYISEKEGLNNNMFMIAETLKSNQSVLIMNMIDVYIDDKINRGLLNFYDKEREISGEFDLNVSQGQKIRIEKKGFVKCYDLIVNTKTEKNKARQVLKSYSSFEQIRKENEEKWNEKWKEAGIDIKSEQIVQPYLNFYLYHLLISYSENTMEAASGFPSYSVQGEKNHGLSGWEELFNVPFISLHFPDVSKKILGYRNARLAKAVENASSYKINGALFPWKSGIDGKEQSNGEKYNPITKTWQEDFGYLQRHINISVAYNIVNYFKTTRDYDFFYKDGIIMLFEICRFWADSVLFDRNKNRYELNGLIGPDEFHTKYSNSYSPGIDNNAYTNLMVVWLFINALQLEQQLPDEIRKTVFDKLNLKKEELDKWKDISMFMKIEINDDEIIEQFKGFFKLDEIDWNEYRKKFTDIHNIDKILYAEGKSTNDFQIIKQADSLLSFYFLTPEEIRNIMLETGYLFDKDFLNLNFEYYIKRTSHSSLLSKPIHALIAHHNKDYSLCYKLFYEALSEVRNCNYDEIWEYGINFGVVGAITNVIYAAFAGINIKENHIFVTPKLPADWESISFRIHYRGALVSFNISKNEINIECLEEGKEELYIDINSREYLFNKGNPVKMSIN